MAIDMIDAGLEGEIVVSGRLGGLLPAPDHPLVDGADFRGCLEHPTNVEYRIDPDLDHAIGDVPAAWRYCELMTAAAQLRPSWIDGERVTDVRFIHR